MEEATRGDLHHRNQVFCLNIEEELAPTEIKKEEIVKENRLLKQPSLSERIEEFQNSKLWKTYRHFFTPLWLITITVSLWVLFTAADFVVVQNGEFYTAKTKCDKPLVLFKDSPLRNHKKTPFFDFENGDFESLNEAKRVSQCYLDMYKENMSCITPLAYGVDLPIITLRTKDGKIRTFVNPQNPNKEGKSEQIPESNTLFPHSNKVLVKRPLSITIEYQHEASTLSTETFHLADAFCILSGLDMFQRTMPSGNMWKRKKKQKKEQWTPWTPWVKKTLHWMIIQTLRVWCIMLLLASTSFCVGHGPNHVLCYHGTIFSLTIYLEFFGSTK